MRIEMAFLLVFFGLIRNTYQSDPLCIGSAVQECRDRGYVAAQMPSSSSLFSPEELALRVSKLERLEGSLIFAVTRDSQRLSKLSQQNDISRKALSRAIEQAIKLSKVDSLECLYNSPSCSNWDYCEDALFALNYDSEGMLSFIYNKVPEEDISKLNRQLLLKAVKENRMAHIERVLVPPRGEHVDETLQEAIKVAASCERVKVFRRLVNFKPSLLPLDDSKCFILLYRIGSVELIKSMLKVMKPSLYDLKWAAAMLCDFLVSPDYAENANMVYPMVETLMGWDAFCLDFSDHGLPGRLLERGQGEAFQLLMNHCWKNLNRQSIPALHILKQCAQGYFEAGSSSSFDAITRDAFFQAVSEFASDDNMDAITKLLNWLKSGRFTFKVESYEILSATMFQYYQLQSASDIFKHQNGIPFVSFDNPNPLREPSKVCKAHIHLF